MAEIVEKRGVGGTRSRRVRRVAGAVVVLLAAVSTACARSDEDHIRRLLEELAQTVSVEDGDTPMIRQARATRLTTYLTVDANVDIGAPFSPMAGRDAILQVAASVRVPAGGVTIEFTEVRVTIDPRARGALVIATASVMAGGAGGGELLHARELNMVFSEIGGEWLIDRVRLVISRRGYAPNPTRVLRGDPQSPTPHPRGAHVRALPRGSVERLDEDVAERSSVGLCPTPRLGRLRGPHAPRRFLAGAHVRAVSGGSVERLDENVAERSSVGLCPTPARSLAGAPRPAPLPRGRARARRSGGSVERLDEDVAERSSVGLCPTPRLGRLRGPHAPRRFLAGAHVRAAPVVQSSDLTKMFRNIVFVSWSWFCRPM